MHKPRLTRLLENMQNAKRVHRMSVVHEVIGAPVLFPHLLKTVFETDNKLSIKAAWTLELICERKLDWLLPHLDYFTANLDKVVFDSAVRPLSKICGFLAKSYTAKTDNSTKEILTTIQIDRIIEVGFDWMIGQQKVAVKVYTMEMLFLFGENYDWVHEELKLIILQNIAYESCGYQARGKKILYLINKK